MMQVSYRSAVTACVLDARWHVCWWVNILIVSFLRFMPSHTNVAASPFVLRYWLHWILLMVKERYAGLSMQHIHLYFASAIVMNIGKPKKRNRFYGNRSDLRYHFTNWATTPQICLNEMDKNLLKLFSQKKKYFWGRLEWTLQLNENGLCVYCLAEEAKHSLHLSAISGLGLLASRVARCQSHDPGANQEKQPLE